MPGWDNRYSRRRVQKRVAMRSENQCVIPSNKVCKRRSPLSPPTDDELEDAVSVWCTELDLVFSGLAGDGEQRSTHVRVKHSELEL